jgi:hypothetical protein
VGGLLMREAVRYAARALDIRKILENTTMPKKPGPAGRST